MTNIQKEVHCNWRESHDQTEIAAYRMMLPLGTGRKQLQFSYVLHADATWNTCTIAECCGKPHGCAKRQHHAIGSDFCLVMTFVLVGNGMPFLSNVCHLGLSYFLTDKGSAVAETARRLTHTSRVPCPKVLSQKIQIFQETSFCVLQVSLLDFTDTI